MDPRIELKGTSMMRPEPKNGKYFDFEKLIVHRLAKNLLTRLLPFLKKTGRKAGTTIDHLDRALDSIVLNIAEGAGKERGSKDRARFYRIALGSAKVAGAALDLLALRRLIARELADDARDLLLEIVAILHCMSR
jgi:four helix bundle protein